MTDSCKNIKVLVTPDCTQCYKTTVETVAYDYNDLAPLNYITFPLNPNADDIHVGLFNDYSVWYRYTGTQWQVEGARLGIESQPSLDWVNILNKPTTFPPINHTHSTYESQILALQNDVDAAELEVDGIQTAIGLIQTDVSTLQTDITTLAIADIALLQTTLDGLQDDIDLFAGDDWGTQVVEKTSAFTGNGTVGTPLGLADNAVTNTKIADGSISTTKIIDGQITNLKLGNNSVIESKIADLNVTTNKIADGSVTAAKLAANAVLETNILNSAVTVNKIANNSVITAKILDNNITTAKIADNAVTVAKLPTGATSTTFLKGDGTWSEPSLSFTESVLGSNQLTATSPTAIVTISLTAGTWLINSITQLSDTLTNNTFTSAIYNNTTSSTIVKGMYTASSIRNTTTLSKIITVGSTTSIQLRVSSTTAGATIDMTDTLINAIKIA